MNTHKFEVEDAEKYGIEKAILLEHLKFHQEANSGNSEMIINGKPHAFLKPDTIKNMYPYMNYKSITRWLRELEEEGVIESCKPKKSQGEHLKYYHVIRHKIGNSQNESSKSQSEPSMNSQNESSSIVTNVELPSEGHAPEVRALPQRIADADLSELKEIWWHYRKEKNHHPSLTEREMKEHEIDSWGVKKARKIIKFAISNGYKSIRAEYLDEEESESDNTPFPVV